MSTRHGKDGVVKVGAVTIAEVDNWSLNQAAAVANDTAMGDDWETHIAGKTIKSWNGQLTCHYDPTDLTGQGALDVGASVTLKLYAEGTATGAIEFSGTATITAVGLTVAKDAVEQRTFSFQGNGALAEAAVA